MLQLLLVLATLATLFYYYGIKPLYYWRELGVKQTYKPWVFGDNFRTVFRLEGFADMVIRVYNQMQGVRYLGMYQFTLPILLIKDPELIKQVGVKDFEHFVDHKSFIPENADPLWGKNLFALKGQRWREMRPIISSSFTSSKMKNIFVLMSECAQSFNNYFLKQNKDIVEVEMKDSFTRYTNDVIATTAFGIKIDSFENQTNDFYTMAKEATDFSTFSKIMKFFGYILIPKVLEIFKIPLFEKHVAKFFTTIINDNIKARKEKGIVRPDLIHLLMEAQKELKQKEKNSLVDNGFETVQESNLGKPMQSSLKQLTNMDMAAQAMIFFFAGFDTVSSVMSFMSYELAIQPDIQKRLKLEVEKTLEECKGDLTYEALLKMKYMDMVVSEALRKWPSVIAIDRICTKPYTIQPVGADEKPLHLNTGTFLWFPVIAIHRDPAIYPDPERFDPERFNDENKGNINPHAYIPFGIGPRHCIGNRFAVLEIKTIMFYILSKFEIVPTAKTVIPIQISKKQFNLSAEGGFPLGLKRVVK